MPITITSRFKPLTYDEITRPLIEQTQAQEALEDAYMQASDQAAQIMAQANQQTDPVAYARLKSYSDELQQQADSLMRQGLNRNSRQSLLNMRRKYNQSILPVQTAINRRNELMEERRKMQLANPDTMWERDMLSIDDLLQNPQLDYGETISGSDITKRAAAITSAIGKGRQSIALGRNLDKYTQTVLSQSGLSAEEIQAALSGDDSALDKALGNLYASTGVENWGSQASKDRVRGFIQEGAMQGVGDFNIATQRDKVAERADEIADRNRSEKFQAALYGKMKDEKGRWVDDPNNSNVKGRTRLKADGSAEDVTDTDFEIIPKAYEGRDLYKKKSDGTWWSKQNGKYYPVNESVVEKLEATYVPADVVAESRIRLSEEPLYFGGDDFDITREDGSSFSPHMNGGKGKLVTFASLTAEAKKKLMTILTDYYPGIKVTDPNLKIYKDWDFNRNEYKVVIE